MHFEENQLFPSSIGISPLSPVHPLRFQPKLVRSSTRCYPRFNLTRDSSLGFGSTQRDYGRLAPVTPYSDSISLRLRIQHLNHDTLKSLSGSICNRLAIRHSSL